MPISYSALKSEILTDPLGLGYAGYVGSGNHVAVANLLNSLSGAGVSGVTLANMARDDFMLAILPAISAIASGTPTIKDKWDRILGVIQAANSVQNNTSIQYLLSQSVQDGLWTQPQANAVFIRNGSRAEVLFGAGTMVSFADVGIALG